jgi:DNA-binding MarR family transcriptional regulator
MQQRGLVVREECLDDARGSWVVLTEAGVKVIHEAAPPHVDSVRRHLIDLLTEGETAALTTLSNRVINHLTHQD